MASCTVGNYRLVDKLGEGGMGAVWRALDLMVDREVAIKTLRPEIARQPEIVERFRAEAVALARLNHPNIATLYSFFREGDEFYMVMEFVKGQPLDAILRGSSPIPVDDVIAIVAQVLDAIEHAGSLGILHRDIKPANILVSASGQVKVTDFGIARVLGAARMTREGCVCGTLEYLAPERIRGQEGDIRSDLYSAGVVLYEMLARHLPFERQDTYELMRAHLEEPPPPFSAFALSVPTRLEMAVRRALAKSPENRFATAREFRTALVSATSNHAAAISNLADVANVDPPLPDDAAAPIGVPAAAQNEIPPARRRGWMILGAVAAVLIVMGITVAWLFSREPSAAPTEQPAAAAPAQAQPRQPEPPPNPVETASPAVDGATQPHEGLPGNDNRASAPAATATRKNAANIGRRTAALKALEKEEPGKNAKGKNDRRSSSLKALND